MSLKIAFLIGVLVLLSLWVSCGKASVSYDHKAISINGKRKILISGSIHYPRSTPEMWQGLIQKGKEGGLDVIETYVFWNGHEPEPGKYYFEGRYDLVKFIKLVQHAGLYVNLRIGPYVCAEWNFGGFPVWLKYVPGMNFRTDNGPFKDAMQKFTTKIVKMMKAERLYESQGGPIILSQIENEFGPLEHELGPPALAYTKWAAKMAVDLATRIPWTMGKQDDAPDPVINTCNGFYCDWFYPNKAYKPKMWSEAWTGWFTEYGGAVPYRPAEDMAFSVARFIQTGGTFINYYMFHGGTNFGRTSGAFMATSYDYDAPLDEYGLLRQPKWGHLRDLHRAIKLCEPALVSGDPNVTSLGHNQEARVFRSKHGACAAFLANYDQYSAAKVSLWNMQFSLPPWSISILPDCKNAVYNTARIGAQRAEMKMTPVSKGFNWQSYSEDTASAYDEKSFTQVGLREQINTTWDKTDYLWYTTEVKIDDSEGFLRGGKWPVLTVNSAGHGLYVFINGRLSGTAFGRLRNPKLVFNGGVNLKAGVNKISLLSFTVGLPNVGTHFERRDAGVLGPVSLSGLNKGKRDLTWQKWTYKVGLKGEALSLHSPNRVSKVRWNGGSSLALRQPLTWYKTTFNAPRGNEPLALDMDSMSKGQVWINGESIGRYWSQSKASGNCSECSYAGWYNENKCHRNCGQASQRWYHVPRSWLRPTGNLMVVFEEWGGNPNGITLTKREVARVSMDIHERQPSLGKGNNKRVVLPKAHLSCDAGQKISSIKYGYGTPQRAFGSCDAFHSYDLYNETCVGQQSCTVPVTPEILRDDPCPRAEKKLCVEVTCSWKICIH